ncbi:unnamed protein product [Rotaria sp. Silwood1]|nr:unnamed protein product [Rotaria sp. Silwood1]CAF3631919.1 unnamed protein product [Rotaria sp. Silwood1]CAF3684264.1 unnamed protein product [Rotaria sp. Silwood1]CAF3841168.1 unnamed protein product [Rotaria sp. Silwood1]CAF4508952.1 unnamed protein product [Rotaria sp. Silwood1]
MSNGFTQSDFQTLLNPASCIHTLSTHGELALRLIKRNIKSTLIGQLEVTAGVHDLLFNNEQCAGLTLSPLRQQCEDLTICLENRSRIISLVNTTSNLQTLTFICDRSEWNHYRFLSSDYNEFIEWLRSRLASTCFVG